MQYNAQRCKYNVISIIYPLFLVISATVLAVQNFLLSSRISLMKL